MQTLIDRLIPARRWQPILCLSATLLLLLGIRALVGYLREKCLILINKNLSIAVTADFLQHLFRLPKQFFDSRKTGDITARLNDSLRIHQTALAVLQSAILDFLLIMGSEAFMFFFSVELALITLTLMPVYVWMLLQKGHRVKDQQNEVMKTHARLESTYIDSIQGINEISTVNSGAVFSRLNQTMFELFQSRIGRLGVLQAGLSLTLSVAGSMISVTMLGFGAVQVIRDNLLLGQFMAAYSLLAYILPSVNNLVVTYIHFQGAHIAVKRLMDILLVKAENSEVGKEVASFSTVRVQGLKFSYPKSADLFKDVSLSIPKGRITGLWGASGAGKSTLVQLLQRKYAPTAGAIYYDDQSIENLSIGQLRSLIGVVPQQIKIFNAVLAENILVGRLARDAQEISTRLAEMGLAQLTERFEDGLFTLLGEEGRKLSGGETQLLGLARALYGRPQLLIIDEGFSAIDPELENALAAIVAKYAAEHAVLLITHNLSSLLRTDYLYLLQDGRIIEEGTPRRLLREESRFRRLWSLKNETQRPVSQKPCYELSPTPVLG